MTRNPQNQGNYIQELLPRRNWERGRADLNCPINNNSAKPTSERELFFLLVHGSRISIQQRKVNSQTKLGEDHASLDLIFPSPPWASCIISRPKAARSNEGVIGSLIATTGNITGAAAPVTSTLQPDVDKRLSRFVPPFSSMQ
jgi:hypothetical protein